MKICVLGLGYIGFPTACLLANAGHQVVGVDVREAVVDRLRDGQIHITDENGLAEIAQSVLRSGALQVSTTPVEADAFIVCVPTPVRVAVNVFDQTPSVRHADALEALSEAAAGTEAPRRESTTVVNSVNRHCADRSYVEAAVESIAPVLRPGNLVIIESTVPPGTTEHVILPILERYGWTRHNILLAHAPERVIPGAIIRELVENDRVIGGLTPAATQAAKELYSTLVKGKIFTTDATTAEFVKLIENTYRDVNIALANEFALVAEHLGIDVQESIALANRHPRVNILKPGPGVGGHCIPVDPYFLIERAPHLTLLMQAARAVNNGMIDHVVKMVDRLSKEENVRRWVVLGAAYKADVGDDRNSPALAIAERMKGLGLSIVIHDPHVERFNRPLETVLEGAEGLLVVTDHTVYQHLNPQWVGQFMARRFVIDARLCLDVDAWRKHGFIVRRLGDGRNH